MKLRLIVAMLVLALASSACYDLVTGPVLEPGTGPASTTAQSDTTERGGTTMGNGD
jgi:hypothetical protein